VERSPEGESPKQNSKIKMTNQNPKLKNPMSFLLSLLCHFAFSILICDFVGIWDLVAWIATLRSQ
jgi:hypothetical protein